ncbi:MAG: glycoside hydrolase family 2 protein [Acidobacteriota bacterium]
MAQEGDSSSAGRLELAQGWRLTSAQTINAQGSVISTTGYDASAWHPVHRMPATVLEILEEDGVYPNLYFGMNLLKEVPQDLYEQDWWYRTTFTAPEHAPTWWLEFPGVNYRAEIWLNGHEVASNQQIVGMYAAHQLNVTQWIRPGQANTLAVKVTPERAIQDVNGVELADSWFDWINWKYLGYQGPRPAKSHGISFVPDRNAGIWKPVYLRISGPVTVSHPLVDTVLPLPRTNSARLTIYAELRNSAEEPVEGLLTATIRRKGKPEIHLQQSITLAPGEQKEASFSPDQFPELTVDHPDLWWPYTMGEPNLYKLQVTFSEKGEISDSAHIHFGIRTITQGRDQDEQFPEVGKGGNFYLRVNGRDFLVRGAVYTPDLLYRYDPARETAILRYVRNMGLNMLRWESKIASEHIVEEADEQGIPLMFGWMCCNQWEKWDQWSGEDHRVAAESLRSQILMLRAHPAVFIWANGSDGLAPVPIRNEYHQILADLHWQNAVVDTVSSFARGPDGNRTWDGIHMQGPYSWRPPTYWFSGKYAASRGACAEQGDNEDIPPYESLKKFIPADKLWPINETWYFHAGSNEGNSMLVNIQRAVNRRYGPSTSAEEFARKAQLAAYEDTRAQFEDFAANGWANHKMTIYWMLNSQWPSFFGHLIDAYLKPGGSYYGAMRGLRPLSVVFDSFATGDHSEAHFTVVNQTAVEHHGLAARIRIYDLEGKIREDKTVGSIAVDSGGVAHILALGRPQGITPVYFVRCELFDAQKNRLVENVYWQSTKDDDLGDPKNDNSFDLQQASWADMTALNTMPRVHLAMSAEETHANGERRVTIRLKNPTDQVAFFERVTLATTKDGDEILPIEYDDNYVTVFPHETAVIDGTVRDGDGTPAWVRVRGYNTDEQAMRIGARDSSGR